MWHAQKELLRERQEAADALKVAEKERYKAHKAHTMAQAEALEADEAERQLAQKAAKAAALDPDGEIACVCTQSVLCVCLLHFLVCWRALDVSMCSRAAAMIETVRGCGRPSPRRRSGRLVGRLRR